MSNQWSKVKVELLKKDSEYLMLLLKELYNLDIRNSKFIESKSFTDLKSKKKSIEYYRSIVNYSISPDLDNQGEVSLQAARRAISDFKKSNNSIADVLDLMIYYVEIGTECICDYGGMYESYNNSMVSMFNSCVKTLKKNQDLKDEFLPRLEKLVKDAEGTGYYFGDSLKESIAQL